MFTIKTGLIIPTRNRPKELYSTLQFLLKNKIKFFKTIVIDSSDKNLKKEIIDISNKFKVKLYFSSPSTSKQRNIGLRKLLKSKIEFIMFLDDDLKFNKNSFNIMNSHINKYKYKYRGFSFSNLNLQKNPLKTSDMLEEIINNKDKYPTCKVLYNKITKSKVLYFLYAIYYIA